MNRRLRSGLKTVCAAAVVVLLATGAAALDGQESAPLPAGSIDALDALVGESLSYDMAFLWFDHLADARLSLEKGDEPGIYRAILEAQTRGVAAFVTRDRNERHVALMERMPSGGLRTLSAEAQTSKGRGSDREERVRRYVFNYAADEVYREQVKRGKFSREVMPMPAGDFLNDVLTAFYNFRSGYFGEIRPGARYEIPTFSRKGPSTISIAIYSEEERPRHRHFPAGGLLCSVRVDQEVFNTGGGQIYLWIDPLDRPARGVVEDVLGLGDVRGTLRH